VTFIFCAIQIHLLTSLLTYLLNRHRPKNGGNDDTDGHLISDQLFSVADESLLSSSSSDVNSVDDLYVNVADEEAPTTRVPT